MRINFSLFILFIPIILLGKTDIELYGMAEQGGLLVGKTSPEIESVFLDYQKVEIQNNHFLIGFSHKAKLQHIITVVSKDGKMRSVRFGLKKKDYDVQEITMPKSKKKYFKPKSPETISRINNEAKRLREARKIIEEISPTVFLPKFSLPINNAPISSKYGAMRIINGSAKKPHLGLDLKAPKGTPVNAMNSGKVILTGDYYFNGKFVLIDHGLGLSSIYIHLSSIDVEIGDEIESGDLIGKVGSTGISTGPHLHWGVRLNGIDLDPEVISKMDSLYLGF
jgi:murein DD-endopeptidase MepM/ murein hydrolase activator NlpD